MIFTAQHEPEKCERGNQNLFRIRLGRRQTCAESHFFKEKSSQVTQKSSHDFDFFEKNKKVKVMTLTFLKNEKSQSHDFDFFKKTKKVKVMTLTFFKGPLENTFRRFL
jgi:hypothetical protein